MLHAKNGSLGWTHYEILSVDERASYDEMRENYKAAILTSHPDKVFAKSGENHPSGDQQDAFLRVREAWEVLSDPKSRESYDNLLLASRNEVDVVDGEISLEEMMGQAHNDVHELLYQCRCGDFFSITSVELGELVGSVKAAGRQASVVLPCGSCSLKIRVIIDASTDLSM
ncbi:hypothetical protein KSP39_PZI003079 [Platanthera zijinensis]|uniref:Diphthamide biosynthesis protein 4 n=1 Tax=Platanthera zijinensis TaxID=2320716 RepID=A0AAP0GBY6_9ASPA